MRPVPTSIAATLCCVLAGCGVSSEDPPGETWLGETPHFSAHGLLNGERIDISIDGDGVADGTHVWCEREYQAPVIDGELDLSQVKHVDTTITAQVNVAGEERVFELELMKHALQADQPGTGVKIVPRLDDQEPAEDEMWLEWEWSTLDGQDLLESAAQEGTFTLEQFTGTPGEGGVIIPAGEGFVGGYADARWSVDEQLSISFTVLCTENDIEETEDGH
jgi:hypothetical protein